MSRSRMLLAGLATVGGLVTASVGAGVPAAFAGPTSVPGASAPVKTAMAASAAETTPTYSYANAVHESIKVDTTMDTDSDGVHDTVTVDIIRPREAVAAGVKVPVIMDASPYYQCCGRGNESETKAYDSNGVISKMPLFYDNYFVPRGYGVVQVDVLGTSRSSGCGDVGGPTEVASVVAVIDWLNGRNTAKTLDGTPVTADWTTGAVGMIGKSYDGTLANAVASTGVDGLKTIVPISAISTWYDYTRSNGVPYFRDYMKRLGGLVGHDVPACNALRDQLAANDADETGNYTSFWADRDYVKDASKVKASVFVVHGLSDYNVETKHFSQWWDVLSKNQVPRKLWLSMEDHVDPFDFRRDAWVAELHKWFDYWLMGIQNGVMSEPTASVETAPDMWTDYNIWPENVPTTSVPLSEGALGSNAGGTVGLVDNLKLKESDIVGTPQQKMSGRQMFLSAPLAHTVRISGTPTLTLRIKADKTTTPISGRLIDYGRATRYLKMKNTNTESCWGESTVADDACYIDVRKQTEVSNYGVIGRGWLDAAHSDSLSNPTPLTPGEWRTVTLPLRAQDVMVLKGHTLGLAITLSDLESTSPNDTGATVDIDLSQSHLNMIVSGGNIVAGATSTPLDVTAAPSQGRAVDLMPR
ncbi:Xaa-Pro dipeptidyl-peptidase [Kribbella sp. NPDC004536]|uniref:Xaa-Pro dipeptidyl-peptidase n=1 Tax=Kribbella sp. NPDC004536 TaxID=3364106 RepID=UPI0036ABCE1A